MDEQRCHLPGTHASAGPSPETRESPSPQPEMDSFLELVASSQGRRMDDQRVSFAHLPGFQPAERGPPTPTPPKEGEAPAHPNTVALLDPPITPSEDYFTLIHRIHQHQLQTTGAWLRSPPHLP
ncbi:Purkinje cell protein 2 homolog [Alligator sinensis]|uniref:Purkinje cell protein 2 homolog n=1 Tax=Alligator sinensis TaxID=38654 RepID=A0A3Q0HNC4_ALLSI|nr:Purkinje cell protein 2 homolog [Alligator sinensis]